MSQTYPHPHLLAAFEQAANDAQVPTNTTTAQHTLAQLSARPDAIQLALALITRTSSPLARFHAAATIRNAAPRLWPTLPAPDRHGPTSIRNALVTAVISNPALVPFERKALLRAAAFLARRAYLDEPPEHRRSFFQLVCDTATAPNVAPHVSLAAADLMDLLLEEFAAPSLSASALAPPLERELLMRARAAFATPDGDLVRLFHAATHVLRLVLPTASAASAAPAAPAPPAHPAAATPPPPPNLPARLRPPLSVLFRVIATDFSNLHLAPPAPDAADPTHVPTPSDALETVVINTFNKPHWAPVVEHLPTVLALVLSLTASLTAAVDPPADPDLTSSALHIITAIASVSHTSYQNREAASALVASLLAGLSAQRWCQSPLGPVRLAYAEVWRRLSCAHGLNNIERLPANPLQVFTNDTCHEMDQAALRLARNGCDDDDFSMDVTDMLLETWANLALQADDGKPASELALAPCIERVVFHFIRMSLRTSGETATAFGNAALPDLEEDQGFDDSSIDDSRLCVAAILTRFALDKMTAAIAQSLTEAADKVWRWEPQHVGGAPPPPRPLPLDLYQEDLFFLVRLTCAVLTDEAKGEYPVVPSQFLPASARDEDDDDDDPHQQEPVANGHTKAPPIHARTLLSALFEVADRESDLLRRRTAHCDEASPRIGAALLDALARVAQTYLTPVNVSNAATVFEVVGGVTVATNGRNICLTKAMEAISMRAFETDVAESAAHLLAVLAGASVHYSDLRESPVWHQLLQAGADAYQTLPPKAVRDVGRSLTTVLGDVVADRLLGPTYEALQRIAAERDKAPDAAERAVATVNLVRGAARSDVIGDRTRDALLHVLAMPNGVALSVAGAFGGTRPDVSRAFIQLADDIIYATLPLLPPERAREVVTSAVRIVEQHAEMVGAHRSDLSEDDLACEVIVIVALLAHILDEDVSSDVGEMCFYGLSTLLPIMTDQVLEVPEVRACFFRFVAQLVCGHADKLVVVPQPLCEKVLHAIDVQHRDGLDASAERRALEAIAALARTRIAAASGGGSGPPDANGNGESRPDHSGSGAVVDAALRGFMARTLEGITSGAAYTDNLDAAADALLPLSHIKVGGQVSLFDEVGQKLLLDHGNSEALRGAVQDLGRVACEAGGAYGRDRVAMVQATKMFREAVVKFSTAARNCLVSVATEEARQSM